MAPLQPIAVKSSRAPTVLINPSDRRCVRAAHCRLDHEEFAQMEAKIVAILDRLRDSEACKSGKSDSQRAWLVHASMYVSEEILLDKVHGAGSAH